MSRKNSHLDNLNPKRNWVSKILLTMAVFLTMTLVFYWLPKTIPVSSVGASLSWEAHSVLTHWAGTCGVILLGSFQLLGGDKVPPNTVMRRRLGLYPAVEVPHREPWSFHNESEEYHRLQGKYVDDFLDCLKNFKPQEWCFYFLPSPWDLGFTKHFLSLFSLLN